MKRFSKVVPWFARILSVFVLFGLLVTNVPALSINDTVAAQKKTRLQHESKVNKNILHIKLRAESGIALKDGQFVGGGFLNGEAAQVATLNSILSTAKKIKAEPIVTQEGGSDKAVANSVRNYYRIRFAQDLNLESILLELEKLPIVEIAYAQPKPVKTPTANYTTLQSYLKAAPTGVDRAAAVSFPWGGGGKVKIVDIEYGWNVSHEDLSKARAALVPNGTPVDPFNDSNHGTAVVGTMLADSNTFGMTGILPGASLALINAYNKERGWDVANALIKAGSITKPGDIILVEQQAAGITGDPNDFLPIEWYPEVYDAIRSLTATGRIVIQPAGNGYHNLDDTLYGSTFPMGKPDSGAIIVGAGHDCLGSDAPARSRASYSNYGKRVNVQGPGGGCLATTGYGDLNGGAGVNSYYTSMFAGTSSASAVVAAAAASVSSAHIGLNGSPLTAAQLRSILMGTGTPQDLSNAAYLGQIGPQPDLAKALLKTDKTAPSKPGSFTVTLNSSKKPVLKWTASTDKVKVVQYNILRNGVFYAKVSGTTLSFTDMNVTRGKMYKYKVKAVDASNNHSAFTSEISIYVKY